MMPLALVGRDVMLPPLSAVGVDTVTLVLLVLLVLLLVLLELLVLILVVVVLLLLLLLLLHSTLTTMPPPMPHSVRVALGLWLRLLPPRDHRRTAGRGKC